MTKPDHVLATMLQLKYLDTPRDDCIYGLLEQLGLDGEKARGRMDGDALLDKIQSSGEGMFAVVTETAEQEPFAVPQMMAFVRRGGMTYFFDPAHGLFEYGPLQDHALRRKFEQYGYNDRTFRCWTVRTIDEVDDTVEDVADETAMRRPIMAGRLSR